MKTLFPYKGFDDIPFKMSYEAVCKTLRKNNVKFTTEHWPNKGCSPEVAWDIIRVGEDVSFFFAKGKMFKIYVENGFSGCLENGVSMGMTIAEAQSIDPSIQYDDWEEEYTSNLGYWLEDDLESHEIISITVFIKELEDEEVFFRYEWCEYEENES